MKRKSRKRSAHRVPEEVKFVSICTNGSFLDTLGVDRTYETVAGVSRIVQPPPSRRRPGPRAGDMVKACGGDMMSGERQYTMLRLSPALSALTLPSQRSPANLRLLIGSRLEKARARVSEARSSEHGSCGSETNSRLPCARSIPSNKAPSCGSELPLAQPQTLRRWLSVPPVAGRPVCRQFRSDTGSHSRASIASREKVTNNKTTRGSLLRASLIADCSRPLTVGEGQGSASRDGLTLSIFARPSLESEPARRLRLEAGFTSAVYDTSYQGSPPIRQTR